MLGEPARAARMSPAGDNAMRWARSKRAAATRTRPTVCCIDTNVPVARRPAPPSAGPVEPHHRVNLVVLGIDERRHRVKPAFSNARIEARLRTSGSATQARVSARAKTTSEANVRITYVPSPDPARRASPRKMSRPAASSPASIERGVLGIVGEEVRLDEPDVPAGDDDHDRGRSGRGPRSRPGTPQPPRS